MKKLILTTASVLVLVACNNVKAEEYTVKMVTNMDADQVYYFEPNELTIQPGDTLIFINAQEDFHNVVFDRVPKGAESVESPMLEEEGGSWSYTFNVAGTYGFHCHPHASGGMMGTLIVGEPSEPKDMQESSHGEHDHGAVPDDEKEQGMQCEAGKDCPMHEDMKHGGDHGHMRDMNMDEHQKNTEEKESDHSEHEH